MFNKISYFKWKKNKFKWRTNIYKNFVENLQLQNNNYCYISAINKMG